MSPLHGGLGLRLSEPSNEIMERRHSCRRMLPGGGKAPLFGERPLRGPRIAGQA